MQFRNAMTIGTFDAKPVGGGDREYVNTVVYSFEYRRSRNDEWKPASVTIHKGYRFNGTSRPGPFGWLVPRYGALSEASGLHDFIFEHRPFLEPGVRLSRKDADELFLEFMRMIISRRDPGMWTETRERLAVAMYVAVRKFGSSMWDAHDGEFKDA